MMNDKLSDEVNWTLGDRYNLSLPVERRSNKKKNFFYRDQLQGMQDIKRAWGSVSSETISNCYLPTGLFEPLQNSNEVRLVAKQQDSGVMEEINDQLSIWEVGRYTEGDLLEAAEEEVCLPSENSKHFEELDGEDEDQSNDVNEALDNEMLIQAFQTIMHLSKGEEEDVAFMQAVKDRASKLVLQIAATKTKQSTIYSYFQRQ